MTPNLTTLRLCAIRVSGVARLADHRADHDEHPGSRGAVRVFDEHVEIDLVLAAGHSVRATTAALRTALAPVLGGRALHVTVVDAET